jgi:hypothetical protein
MKQTYLSLSWAYLLCIASHSDFDPYWHMQSWGSQTFFQGRAILPKKHQKGTNFSQKV